MPTSEQYEPKAVEHAIDNKRDVSLRGLTDKAVSFTTPATANQEFTVKHGQPSVPYNHLILSIDKGGIIYWGQKASDRTYAYLRCSVANAKVKLIFF